MNKSLKAKVAISVAVAGVAVERVSFEMSGLTGKSSNKVVAESEPVRDTVKDVPAVLTSVDKSVIPVMT